MTLSRSLLAGAALFCAAGFALPADRFARATLRLTLRQQHRLAERFGSRIYAGLVARWRDAFDRASDTAAEDDNPGH